MCEVLPFSLPLSETVIMISPSICTLHIDREINRASEVFLAHFFRNYDILNRPPSWMILKVLSFGTISELFENLRQKRDGKRRLFGA